jgi:putative transposase
MSREWCGKMAAIIRGILIMGVFFTINLSSTPLYGLLESMRLIPAYEAIREWSLKFGQTYANGLRRRRPLPGDKWHLDEVFIKIRGEDHYLWRAVDQNGIVLDILVQSRRNKLAAKRFFSKLLKGLQYVARVLITDKLKSYDAAKAEIMPGVEHRQHKGLNNRAENSHQPTRVREKGMRRFKSAGHVQRFLSAFGIVSSHFRPRRHLLTAERDREEMRSRFASWVEVSCVQIAT